MHVQIESQVFGRSQRHTRRSDTLYRRVVGQIHEHDSSVDRSCSAEVRGEKVRFLISDSDRRKDYREVSGIVTEDLCLTGNLCSQIRMGKSASRENWKFLSPDQRVQAIDGRYAGLNELRRVISGCRVHRKSVDVHLFLCDNLRSAVLGTPHSVEYTSQHLR